MTGKITLCDNKLIGDIPEYEVKSNKEAFELINHWLETKKDSVFVCFNDYETLEFQYRIPTIYVTMDTDWILDEGKEDVVEGLNFSIFEFKTFEDAFDYCADLKEGF